jgi:ankyrin repeat protein
MTKNIIILFHIVLLSFFMFSFPGLAMEEGKDIDYMSKLPPGVTYIIAIFAHDNNPCSHIKNISNLRQVNRQHDSWYTNDEVAIVLITVWGKDFFNSFFSSQNKRFLNQPIQTPPNLTTKLNRQIRTYSKIAVLPEHFGLTKFDQIQMQAIFGAVKPRNEIESENNNYDNGIDDTYNLFRYEADRDHPLILAVSSCNIEFIENYFNLFNKSYNTQDVNEQLTNIFKVKDRNDNPLFFTIMKSMDFNNVEKILDILFSNQLNTNLAPSEDIYHVSVLFNWPELYDYAEKNSIAIRPCFTSVRDTIAHEACLLKHDEMIRLIAKNNKQLFHANNDFGQTPFSILLENGMHELCKELELLNNVTLPLTINVADKHKLYHWQSLAALIGIPLSYAALCTSMVMYFGDPEKYFMPITPFAAFLYLPIQALALFGSKLICLFPDRPKEIPFDINTLYVTNDIPLPIYFVMKKNVDLLKAFIKAGGDVNAQDKIGNTALHYAVLMRSREIVSLLLENDADPFLSNQESESAYDLAQRAAQLERRAVSFNLTVGTRIFDLFKKHTW